MSPRAQPAFRFWSMSALAGAFWAYATITAVIYAYGIGSAFVDSGVESIFAPWSVRVLQYALLFPPLLGCYWLSLRIGWRPWWRSTPIQISLGLLFAALAPLLLMVAGYALGDSRMFGEGGRPEDLGPALRDYMATVGLAVMTDFFIRYGFGLALVTGAELYKEARDAELRAADMERAWSSARLHALRMQLSPHALFNLLNLIKGQIGWDPPAAQRTVVMLADLLRRLLRAGDRDFVRLADELEFVKLYLELQRQRFPDRLHVALPNANAFANVWLPSLILQPLVENAVAHGLEGHDGANRVTVAIAGGDDHLVLEVANDLPPTAPPARAGVGLSNVRERLAVHFGGRANVTAEAGADGRWHARIDLPLLRDEPASASAMARGAMLVETRA
jgi:Histidine kinase